MKTTIKEIETKVISINTKRGFTNVNYNTIGAITLYKDICGYQIQEITNIGGGVRNLSSYGLTKNEVYDFLLSL